MKKHFLLIAAIFVCVAMMAEEEAAPVKDWKWSGIVGLNATATGMANWAAGGKNNVTGTAFGKVRCLYDKNNLSWETNLDVEYGLSYVDQKYDKLQKASDHLKLDTKFGWAFKKSWYLTVNASFQTQFDLGKEYSGTADPNKIISNILAPSYTDISVGIDWKPNSIFSIYLSPVAGRITTAYVSDKVNDRFENEELYPMGLRQALQETYGTWKYTDSGDDGYTKEYKNAKPELGLTLKGSINWTYKDLKIITGVTLYTPYAWDKTKLYKFTQEDGTSYIFSENQEDKIEKKGFTFDDGEYIGYRDNNRRFCNFDVDWTTSISYQCLKCLNITLSTDLKYVNGLSINGGKEKVQFLANLGLGVSYSF